MINRFFKVLERHGYQKVNLNTERQYLYCKRENKEELYLVLVWDLEGVDPPEKEKYDFMIRQIKMSFFQTYEKVSILSILYTDKVESVRELCGDWDQHWIFDINTMQLIIYENQEGEFLNVKELIEESIKPITIKDLPICTISIVAVNVLIFFILEIRGSTLNTKYMYEAGAMYWPDIVEKKQYYRLFTSMFLHFGIEHLANNMIVLLYMGNILEKILGKAKYLFIYFISGILAGAASMQYNIFQEVMPVAAGASGAIFGIVGAMVYIVTISKGKVENLTLRQVLFFAFLSLYTGLTSQGVDNMAHIGGLVSGLVLTVLVWRKPRINKKTD